MKLFRQEPLTRDIRDFLSLLEKKGQLKRISSPVDSDLEIAAISDRVLGMGGPALLFENVKNSSIPVAVNLLGTMERVVWSMGLEKQEELEDLGKKLALLQQPRPPKGFKETKAFASVAWDLLKARPDIDLLPPCHQKVITEENLDLNLFRLSLSDDMAVKGQYQGVL